MVVGVASYLSNYTALRTQISLGLYGTARLRRDPRSVMLPLLQLGLSLGLLSCLVSLVGKVGGWAEGAQQLAWPMAFAGIAAGSVAVVLAWRHRTRSWRADPVEH